MRGAGSFFLLPSFLDFDSTFRVKHYLAFLRLTFSSNAFSVQNWTKFVFNAEDKSASNEPFFPYFLFYAFALYTHANHVHYNHTPPPTTLECLRHVALYIYVSIFIPSFLAPFNQFVLYDLCLVFLQLQRILKYLVSLFSPAYVYSFAKAKRIRVYQLIFTLA